MNIFGGQYGYNFCYFTKQNIFSFFFSFNSTGMCVCEGGRRGQPKYVVTEKLILISPPPAASPSDIASILSPPPPQSPPPSTNNNDTDRISVL